ncbi:mitotic spindle checkpoint component Mad2p [[Candida] railenensis]|uniref:Mitotic spindle checkpoint component Mad2p n=1 Tax=[Candida] railenensis TaxID=45579 RepID=A0A9P0QQG2_9ASCO|nr:mitotic spindle checkpoint component Mad2p [[Candida] railenensis]
MPSKLAIKGSSKIVADYFEFAINNILFQRGIYPPEDFQTVRKYGLPMLLTSDDEVKQYIEAIMIQVKKWIYGGKINKLVVVIVSKSTVESVEKWEFDLQVLNSGQQNQQDELEELDSKTKEETQREIQSLIRQITSSVSYLPMLKDDEYTFNVLVHTDPTDPYTPKEWCEGEDRGLQGPNVENVQFRSFSTNIHQIGTQVTYNYEK